jgi:phage-related protein (TIGR01555 family)
MSPGLVGWLRRRFAGDTLTSSTGIRGAGAESQADFGEPIDEADLLFAVQREPVAYRTVFQVAHDVFDNWFKLEEVSEKPDPDFDRLAQYALADLNAKAVLTRIAVFERLAGWAIIVVGYVDHGKSLADPLENPSEIRELAPYMGDVQVTVQSTDEDKDPNSPRFGLPIHYTLNRGAGLAQQKVHFTRVIHFATRLLVHPYKGLSVLEPIYDDSQAWRNIRWGMGQTIFRYGSGFPDVEVIGANKKMLDDLEASQQFTNLQSRTYFLHSDKTKLEFKGLAGRALDPEPYCQAILESLSTGTCIPTAMLRGVQAGALTGSGVNEREYFKLISDLQSLYEPGVWELIDTLLNIGQIPARPDDYEVRWLGGFEINEIDKSTVELNRARADDLRSQYMTVNELRARQNPPLKALPEPEGNIIPGSLQKQQPFSQSQNVTEQKTNEENRN